jgi:S1-C subfamily serine protease
VGDTLKFSIWRNKGKTEITLILAKNPDSNEPSGFFSLKPSINADLIDYSDQGLKGVRIQKLHEFRAAEKSGLLVNDVILKVDGTEIISTINILSLIEKKKPGDKITVSILRNGNNIEKILMLHSLR